MTRYVFQAPDTGSVFVLTWDGTRGLAQLIVVDPSNGNNLEPTDIHDIALAKRLAAPHYPTPAHLERALRAEAIDWSC